MGSHPPAPHPTPVQCGRSAPPTGQAAQLGPELRRQLAGATATRALAIRCLVAGQGAAGVALTTGSLRSPSLQGPGVRATRAWAPGTQSAHLARVPRGRPTIPAEEAVEDVDKQRVEGVHGSAGRPRAPRPRAAAPHRPPQRPCACSPRPPPRAEGAGAGVGSGGPGQVSCSARGATRFPRASGQRLPTPEWRRAPSRPPHLLQPALRQGRRPLGPASRNPRPPGEPPVPCPCAPCRPGPPARPSQAPPLSPARPHGELGGRAWRGRGGPGSRRRTDPRPTATGLQDRASRLPLPHRCVQRPSPRGRLVMGV